MCGDIGVRRPTIVWHSDIGLASDTVELILLCVTQSEVHLAYIWAFYPKFASLGLNANLRKDTAHASSLNNK